MKFLLLLFLFPLTPLAQKDESLPKDLAGVWKGYMYNDTTQQKNDFELAISENGKKLSGYTYTIFLIDGKKNIGIKSVKIKIRKELLLIEDEKLIDNNYDAPPAKGVRTFIELNYTENDTTEILTGSWKTNITREYNSVTGNIFLERKKQMEETAIIPKLRQLNLLGQLSFLPPSGSTYATNTLAVKKSTEEANMGLGQQKVVTENEIDIAAIVKNEKQPTETERITPDTTITNPEITIFMFPKNDLPAKDTLISLTGRKELEKTKQENANMETVNNVAGQRAARDAEIAKNSAASETEKKQKKDLTDVDKNKKTAALDQASTGKNEPVKDPSSAELLAAKNKTTTGTDKVQRVDSIVPDKKNETSILHNPTDKKEVQEIFSINKIASENTSTGISEPGVSSKEKELAEKTAARKLIAEQMLSTREIETIRTVEIERDTLIFSLFDNGVIDGDTVSVFLNGEVIMSKIGLLARAYNDTIYLTPEMGDSIHIILYAENLGSIPPNTGLLVVREGKINHEIRFSGDLKKNSAIILKRKRHVIDGQ